MWISTKGEYGLRALFALALSYGQGLLQTKEIASQQGIPDAYLSQLLTMLRRAGLVSSRRGPQGGHTLARPPSEIQLAEAVAVLEGSTALAPCDSPQSEDCPFQNACVLRDVWQEVNAAADDVLASITLEDLRKKHIQRAGRVMYYI